ncbi:MAG: hypothetical protein AVDCRST_MAG93-6557 [uncultured Chloroflexia bacterium]|uniref:Uncharacterized protein n=1 Tax=uncultured Chloroflexia bacterium TaxID=1672391 RepID=A0A6J4LQ66_9CHLR|nr:MAG: hypothetical protein AVDCRST_MAG93-6557 [uncultured Chloroflexia bacterium]
MHTSDADRLAHLYGLEQANDRLSDRELREYVMLSRREAARALLEAIRFAIASDKAVENALGGVGQGLALTVTDDDTRRLLGYVVGLRALLAAPDAVHAAIRVLYAEVLALDPDAGRALEGLAPLT